MKNPGISLQAVLSALAREGHVPTDWVGRAESAVARQAESAPWFVRVLVGGGAWLASLLIVLFVVLTELVSSEGGLKTMGLLMMAGAVLVRRMVDNDFFNQAALAVSLGGQALLAIGMSRWLESESDLDLVLGVIMLVNVVLFVFYPDATHRFLSVLIVVGAFAGNLFRWEAQWVLAWLAPLLAALWLGLVLREGRCAVHGWGERTGPAAAGLMVAAFAVVMLSTLYVVPELKGDVTIYPNPWISTLLFGVLLAYALWKVLAGGLQSRPRVRAVIYAISGLSVAAAWQAPGLVYALVVVLVGAGLGHKTALGAGLAFLVLFCASYFYGMEISMLAKSLTLLATGAVLLAGRGLLLSLWPAPQGGRHA